MNHEDSAAVTEQLGAPAVQLIERGAAQQRRWPAIYFGWRVVLSMFLCTAALLGVAIYAFIMFAGPLAQRFGWSPAQTGILVSAMWLVGPLALLAAPVIRKFGPWRLVLCGLAMEAILLFSIQFITSFWQLYLLRMLMGVGKIMVMTSLPVIIARWFDKGFGTAMAIAWAGGAAGGILLAPATERLNAALGWRMSLTVLSLGVLAVTALCALIARGAASPADLRLAADGVPLYPEPEQTASGRGGGQDNKAAEEVAEISESGPDVPPPVAEIWRSLQISALLPLCLSIFGASVTSIGVQSQEPEIFRLAGLSSATSGVLLGLTSGAALFGSIAVGWLLDHFRPVAISALISAIFFSGILVFLMLHAHAHWALGATAALLCGFAFGGGEVLWIALFKLRFGNAAFAVTYGVFYFSLQIGFASGGGLGGWGLERYGIGGFVAIMAAAYIVPAVFSVMVSRRVSARS